MRNSEFDETRVPAHLIVLHLLALSSPHSVDCPCLHTSFGRRAIELVLEPSDGSCIAERSNWEVGTVVARQVSLGCTTQNTTLFATLQPGSRYHVVVSATNAAGLRSSTSSASLIS